MKILKSGKMNYKSKTIALLLVSFTVLIGCVSQTTSSEVKDEFLSSGYSWEDQEIDGMKYRIFFKTWTTSQTGYAIAVVNLTKDKLEVEMLKKQTR